MSAGDPSTRPPSSAPLPPSFTSPRLRPYSIWPPGPGSSLGRCWASGCDVVAVEPQSPLREVLAASVSSERVREGLAEAIPLPDESVVAVTVADAFHWFDHTVALAEIRRVLRPGGGLAVLSAVPDWGGASWAHEVGTLMAGLRPEHPHFDGPPWQDAVRAAGGWTAPREIRVTTIATGGPRTDPRLPCVNELGRGAAR